MYRALKNVLVWLSITVSLNAQAVNVTGSIRTRLENWDWFRGAADGDYAFSGTIGRISLAQKRQSFSWQAEFAAPVFFGLPESSIAPAPQGQSGLGASYFAANGRRQNTASLFLKQGFIETKGYGEAEAHSVRLGRFEFVDGAETSHQNATVAALKRDRIAHRLLGTFGWTVVGRSYDGARYTYRRDGTNVTVAGMQPTRGVFQTDGWGRLDVAVGYGAYTRAFKNADLRVFVLQYADWRNVLKTDNRPSAVRQGDNARIDITTVGGHYARTVDTAAAIVDVLLWGAVQTGSWGALNHRAASGVAEAGWQPRGVKYAPWFRGGYNFGSGDGNAADGRHGTFFQVLPTPRIYARFPFHNMMNNRDAFGEAIVRPHKRLAIRADIHRLSLASASDSWYQGGGAFQPWTFGYTGRLSGGKTGLATVYGVSADWTIDTHFTLGAYAARAKSGDVIRSVYPDGRAGSLAYVELGYKF